MDRDFDLWQRLTDIDARQQSATVHASEKEHQPLLYRPDGTPLALPPVPFGFRPPKADRG